MGSSSRSSSRSSSSSSSSRAFKDEAKGDKYAQIAFAKMCDYSDNVYMDERVTWNTFYKCAASGCRAVIRADKWTQRFTIEEEARGRSKQRWYCHCGAAYKPKFGCMVEFIDHARTTPDGRTEAWYLRAEHPPDDIKDLKTMMHADRLKRDGAKIVASVDILQYLPVITPVALGSVLEPVRPGDPAFEGHSRLAGHLAWDHDPEFNWSTVYAQAKGHTDKWKDLTANQKKKATRQEVAAAEDILQAQARHKLEEAKGALTGVMEYETRHGLKPGSILAGAGITMPEWFLREVGVDATGKDTGVSLGGLAGGSTQHSGDMSDRLGPTLSC